MLTIHESQLPALGAWDENTLHAVLKNMRILDNGMRAINDERLGVAFRKSLHEWLASQPTPVVDPETEMLLNPPDPPPSQPKPKPAPEQRQANIRAAQERYLRYWVAQQGLLNSPENAAVLDGWFRTHDAEYSPVTIDAAIAACRPSLQWYRPPVVEQLPNGDERMPLSARPSPKWTKAQLQDWDARRRAALRAERRAENTKLAKQYR